MSKGDKIRAKKRRKAAGIQDINPLVNKNWPSRGAGSDLDNQPHDNREMRLAFINAEGETFEGRTFTPDYKPTNQRTRQRLRRALRAESAVNLLKQYGYTGEKNGLFVGYRGLSRRGRRRVIHTIASNKFRAECGQGQSWGPRGHEKALAAQGGA